MTWADEEFYILGDSGPANPSRFVSNYVEPYVTLGNLLDTYFQMSNPILGPAFLYPGTNMFICGEGGVGKSIFTLELALHLAMGKDYLYFNIQRPYTVLFMQSENSLALLHDRFRKLTHNIKQDTIAKLGVTALNPSKLGTYRFYPETKIDTVGDEKVDRNMEMSMLLHKLCGGIVPWNVDGAEINTLSDEATEENIAHDADLEIQIEEHLERDPAADDHNIRYKYGTPPPYQLPDQVDRQNLMFGQERGRPEVIIIDPLISFHGANENDNVQMRAVLDRFSFVARSLGTALIFVHHMGKRQIDGNAYQQSYRGASAIKDFTDTMLLLRGAGGQSSGDDRISLEIEKLRSGSMEGIKAMILGRNRNLQHIELARGEEAIEIAESTMKKGRTKAPKKILVPYKRAEEIIKMYPTFFNDNITQAQKESTIMSHFNISRNPARLVIEAMEMINVQSEEKDFWTNDSSD